MKPMVFVIDDETAARELLYDALSRHGCDVTTVGSGPQALEMLKARRPSLILVDAVMPGLSGLETIQRIREFDGQTPIVLLRQAGEADMPPAELQKLGVSEALQKETDGKLMFEALDPLLKRLQLQAAAPAAKPEGMRVPGTLLVVDDDEQVLRLLMTFFQFRGIRVISANCGEAALQALAQKPTAVMLDINMPGMDGLMTLKKLKAKQPTLPVIMASGVGEDDTIREALASGAYDYVMKPFNLEYLETVVLTKLLLGMEG